MSTSTANGISRFVRNRSAIMAAAATGFLIGAAGLAAADGLTGSGNASSTSVAATSTTSEATSTTSEATSTTDAATSTTVDATSTTVDATSTTTEATSTTDAATSTTVDATSTTVDAPTTTNAATSTSVDAPTTSVTAAPSSTVDAPTTTVDVTSTTVDATSTTVDDDRGSVAPFTRSYRSSGGSITVTWNGSSLSLDAVSPEPGYHAEIEDNGGDRVRVDFESDDHDSRIEIRVDGDEVRERVEG